MPFVDHPACKPPDDENTRIWHYIPLSRLLQMMVSQKLWFSKPRYFEDPFEGAVPDKVAEAMRDGDITHRQQWEPWVNIVPDRLAKEMYEFNQGMCVNCWYIGKDESAAMWKIHAGADGIAIRSTLARFKDALCPAQQQVYIGCVSYVDFETFEMEIPETPLPVLLHKRLEFKHERELRAVTPPFLISEGPTQFDRKTVHERRGVEVDIDVNALIEEIRVSPVVAESLLPTVEDVVRRYGLKAPVCPSKIAATPRFLTR